MLFLQGINAKKSFNPNRYILLKMADDENYPYFVGEKQRFFPDWLSEISAAGRQPFQRIST